MTNERAVQAYQEQPHELTLPDGAYLRRELDAVRQFQRLAHEMLIEGSDFGVIPGTKNPTLLKPGAEKIVKLLGLADTYEIVDKVEDWDRPLFRYVIRCKLVSVRSGVVVAEGLGECNSYESRYRYRWVYDREVPRGSDLSKLVSRTRSGKNGRDFTMYRLDNEDIHSQVNTILKMACKRALVAGALSVGRLSEVFTQDMEDIAPMRDDHDDAPAPRPQPQRQQPRDHIVEGTATDVPLPHVPGPQTPKEMLESLNAQRERLGWTPEVFVRWVQSRADGRGPRELTYDEGAEAINALANIPTPTAEGDTQQPPLI